MERGFVIAYLEDVKKILPKHRGRGFTIFTPDIIEKLVKLKTQWKNKTIDWDKDTRDTARVMLEIAK